MSLFVQVRKEDRIVQGELVKIGEHCWLPNAMAVGLEDKGYVAWADGDAQIKEAKRKQDVRDAIEAEEAKAKKRKAN